MVLLPALLPRLVNWQDLGLRLLRPGSGALALRFADRLGWNRW